MGMIPMTQVTSLKVDSQALAARLRQTSKARCVSMTAAESSHPRLHHVERAEEPVEVS
jgi:hypothetical protein